MTFNLLTPNRTAADFNPAVIPSDVEFAHRVPVMAEWLAGAAPDVIGLQENEVNGSAARPVEMLAARLPGYAPVLPELEVPLLVRTSAYAVGETGYQDISQGFWRRTVAWARLLHRSTGRELLVLNTHLDPFQRADLARARDAELAAVVALLRGIDPGRRTPTVLTGDLNIRSIGLRTREAAALGRLRSCGLRDALRVAERDTSRVPGAATLSTFGTEVDGTWRYRAIRTDRLRYDYLFVSAGVTVHGYQVVTGPRVRRIGGRPYFAETAVPSDHCPVQVDLSIPDA